MNLRHLDIFRAVVDAGSASGAGTHLGLSQPAISRAMKQLEEDLGLPLFSRAGGKLTPTAEAMRLHVELDKAFDGIDKAIATAKDAEAISHTSLRLAVVPSLALGLVRRVIGRMTRKNPHLTVSLEVRSHRAVVELVASRGVDVGAASLPVHHPGILPELMATPKTVCMIPVGHPLASAEVITPMMLHDQDFVALNRRNHSRYRLDELFRASGVVPNIRVDVATTEAAFAMVSEGVGTAVINGLTARWYQNDLLVIRPFEPGLGFRFGLLFPRRQTKSETTMAFTEELHAYLAEIGEVMEPQKSTGSAP